MNSRGLPFDPSAHTVVDAILPWYVNKTLRGEELQFVEDHVRGCDACRREAEWLREVYAACAAQPSLDEAALSDASAVAALQRHYGPRKLATSVSGGWRDVPKWARWALAAQLAALAVLGTLTAADFRNEAPYRTLGVENRSSSTPDAIAVLFDPALTMSDIQRILAGAGARIVDGPTVTGAFVLEVPVARADHALQALRSERGVRLAARLGPETAR